MLKICESLLPGVGKGSGLVLWQLCLTLVIVLAGCEGKKVTNEGSGIGASDIVSPSVIVTTVGSSSTDIQPIDMTAIFSENVSGFALSDIVVTDGVAANLTGSGSTYFFEMNPCSDPVTLTVNIPADSAFDGAGNGNEAATQFDILYNSILTDTTQPTVSLTPTGSWPTTVTDVSPFSVRATFSENVTDFALTDLILANVTASNLVEVVGSVYTFDLDVTPLVDGAVFSVDIPAAVVLDYAGTPNANVPADAPLVFTYDSAYDPNNLTPTITDIPDKFVAQDSVLEFVVFNADEGSDAAEDSQVVSVVSVTSSNQTLIPDSSIVLFFVENADGDGGAGELTITPAAGQTGTATITVTITDDGGYTTVSDTFLVTVNLVVDPPTAYPLSAATAQNTAVDITLAAQDTSGFDTITLWVYDSTPANGTLTGTAPNLTYTPDTGYSGRDYFTFYVQDSSGEYSNPALVTLIVNGSAIFFVADPVGVAAGTGPIGDVTVYDEILAQGFTVTLIQDIDTSQDASVANVDFLIISSSCGSVNINTRFKTSQTPVLTWERFLYDDFGMTLTENPPAAGITTAPVTAIEITDPLHPLAGGLAGGAATVFNVAIDLVWAVVSADGEVVAEVDIDGAGAGTVFWPVVFVYEPGDLMQGGYIAPAKRVGYFLPDQGAGDLTADGLALLRAAIRETLAR